MEVEDDLLPGRVPRAKPDGLTLREVLNRFLDAQGAFVEAGQLAPRTWKDYYRTGEILVQVSGQTRPIVDRPTPRLRAVTASYHQDARTDRDRQRDPESSLPVQVCLRCRPHRPAGAIWSHVQEAIQVRASQGSAGEHAENV